MEWWLGNGMSRGSDFERSDEYNCKQTHHVDVEDVKKL